MSQNTTAMQRGAGGETTGATDMTTQQPEALRQAAWLRKEGASCQRHYDLGVLIERQHAELETLRAGYAAARLEIESLNAQLVERAKEHADELTVAYMCGASREKELAAQQPGAAYAALPEYGINTASHAHFRVLGFTADQMRAFADATHALRASRGQAPAKPDPAYSAACNLATALFKKHFAHLPDFASGQAVWSLCDSTAGVISQIDNMVSGLVQPPTTSPQADSVLEDAARWQALPAFFEEYQIDAMKLYRDIDAYLDAARKQGATP